MFIHDASSDSTTKQETWFLDYSIERENRLDITKSSFLTREEKELEEQIFVCQCFDPSFLYLSFQGDKGNREKEKGQ